jgi:hypothetical protein
LKPDNDLVAKLPIRRMVLSTPPFAGVDQNEFGSNCGGLKFKMLIIQMAV